MRMETLALQTQKPTATTKSNKPSAEEVLQKVKQRSEEAEAKRNAEAEAQAILKAKEEADALTDFDKSLFKNGNVDFKNYIGVQQLFDKFRDEATNGVEVRFADYQQSLLHLLKHCYGYMYALKTDSERHETDIKHINNVISGLNKTSNKGNPLSAKIVKLVFRDSVDRKRISTYAKLLDNAWCKGEVDDYTDDNGAVLPQYFEKEVMARGGINNFSRMSANAIEKQQQLKAEGYNSLSEKKIDAFRNAVKTEQFSWYDNGITMPKIKNRFVFDDNKMNAYGDGEFVCFLASYDRQAQSFIPLSAYRQDGADGIVDKAELGAFDLWLKRAKGV